ncbi:MAG: hypothetical protein RBS57_00030 [Desulforhabdus sp.]|nr:hypothetical protein [Desulforhabdus sp.]
MNSSIALINMLTAKIDMGDKVFPALPVVLPLSEVRMTCIDNERITNMVEGHLRSIRN